MELCRHVGGGGVSAPHGESVRDAVANLVLALKVFPPSRKERIYRLRGIKNDSRLTKVLVNNIYSDIFKLIYYKNIFYN